MDVPGSKTTDYRKAGPVEPAGRPRPYHSRRKNRRCTVPEAQIVTYLFSDIEGSTRLWESDPDGAAKALAWHDGLSRAAVERHRGTVVKMTGDGMHAAFDDPADGGAGRDRPADGLAHPADGLPPLKVRCGLHLRPRPAPRQRLLRPRGESRGAHLERRARRPGPAVAAPWPSGSRGTLPPGAGLRELGLVRLQGSGEPRARLPADPSRAARGVSRRCARSRARRTTCRSS